MTLTPEQLTARDGRLTASRVACLMTGDEHKILNLWREMVGDPEYTPMDLSYYWPAVLGAFTEHLSLDWYEKCTGHLVTRRGEVVVAPRANWAAATLDGWDDFIGAVIECKHVGGRERREVVINRYQPQFHWQMIVTETTDLRSSIIEGANEPVFVTIPFDSDYGDELWRRAEDFMRCVESLTPPVNIDPVPAPIIPVKTYDMGRSNAWAQSAGEWLKHRDAAKSFASAIEELRVLIPGDAKIAKGHGIVAARNRAGAISIKEDEA